MQHEADFITFHENNGSELPDLPDLSDDEESKRLQTFLGDGFPESEVVDDITC